MLNILYIFYNLEYKNGDCLIVGLIVSPTSQLLQRDLKIQIKKLRVRSKYVSMLVFTSN